MGLHPKDRNYGFRVNTSVKGVSAERGFPVRWTFPAAKAVAASSAGVLPLTILGVAVQAIIAGLSDPAVPRGLSIVSNKANAVGNVVVTGLSYANEVITETLALNGTTTRQGNKAFKRVTKVDLPVRVNTPVAQVETATVAGTVTAAGRAKCTVTAAGMPGSPLHVPFDVELNDGAEEIAAALRAALAEVEAITDRFDVSGEGASVILTAKAAAANDATLNIATGDGEGEGASAGVTTAATSTNTTAGVAPDTVSVGWNDKLGLPYLLPHNTILDGMTFLNNVRETTEPTVATSATAIESNTIDLHSALNGTVVDAYLMV